ncbi:chaplin family protein [Spirillospora sp. CA-294931]|uniref:chaplin family protein n=1 Tax=Spirillospora sp. CA-294931 TaxID=3240042 RepID=UPI003D8A1E6F
MLKKLAATGILGFAVAGSVLAAAPANADINTTSSGNGSVLGGNQVVAPISVPINICGNAIAVLGVAGAGCKGGAAVIHD